MAERFMAAVLKTADVLKRPWVRIPLSPRGTSSSWPPKRRGRRRAGGRWVVHGSCSETEPTFGSRGRAMTRTKVAVVCVCFDR